MGWHRPQLDWPEAPLRLRTSPQGKEQVLCLARRKWVALEPEEWVRQHVIHHLHSALGYPLGCMAVEHRLMLNGTARRADLVAFTQDQTPRLLVECKAPQVPLSQEVLDQAARYNLVLGVPELLVTNGFHHLAYKVDASGTATALQALSRCP